MHVRLSEDPDLQVLVIEAGEDVIVEPRVNAPAMNRSLLNTSSNWGLRTLPQCNQYFLFVPTSKAHVDAWTGVGNPAWSWSSFSPAAWRDTISNLGFPVSITPFSGQIYDAFMDPESVHPVTRLRSYAGSAYLGPARSRNNLTVWTEALVDKVIFDRNYTDVIKAVKARKEEILSAGAVHTPKILELSGVGDAEILEPLGIDVIRNNPHVGENLQNHVYLNRTNQVVEQEGFETLDKLLQQDPSAIAAAQEALMKGRGPLTGANTSGSAQMPLPFFSSEDGGKELSELLEGLGAKADPGKATAAFFLSPPTEGSGLYNTFPGYMIFGEIGDLVPHPPADERYLTFAVHLAHPLSRGLIHITAPSATSPGLEIDQYLSHPLNVEMMARHVQHVERIKRSEPLAKARAGAWHFTGTCSQLPQGMGGVVDERLRVYGCKNLQVCDLSVAPIVSRCGTQALAYGIAEHAAKIIRSDLHEQ
ncbi:GMC oxidoreductase [Hypoxylon sp. FL0543]|nr:GMC oxidoreductase [Hypoxylon sp. FL0543]